MIRFVVRPSTIRRTPRALARILDADIRRYPAEIQTVFNYKKDLFLTYPHPSTVYNAPDRDHGRFSKPFPYHDLYTFFSATKSEQRKVLGRYVPVPETYVTKYEAAWATPGRWIVRPTHHFGGRGYRLTGESTDFHEGTEYISRVFIKHHEYRIIYVLGEPLITLVKRVPEGLSPELPWNHEYGSSFLTLTDLSRCRLRNTDVYPRLFSFPVVKHAHIVAADVLYREGGSYVISELNACPGITIPDNLTRIANYVKTHHGRQ